VDKVAILKELRSSEDSDLLTKRKEGMFKCLRRSAILGENLGMFELPQDLVYMFAGAREVGDLSACSVNFEVFWRWKWKFLGISSRKCNSSLIVWGDVS